MIISDKLKISAPIMSIANAFKILIYVLKAINIIVKTKNSNLYRNIQQLFCMIFIFDFYY